MNEHANYCLPLQYTNVMNVKNAINIRNSSMRAMKSNAKYF